MIAELIEKGKLKGKPVPPEVIADGVVNQLFSGYGAQIVIPSKLAMVSLVRGLPIWVQERFRNGLSSALLDMQRTS